MRRAGGRPGRWLASFVGFARRRAGWSTTVVSVCCVAGLGFSLMMALGASSASAGLPSMGYSFFPKGPGGSSLTESRFAMSDSLAGGEQVQAQEEVRRSTPEAVAKRAASETKFEHLDAVDAERVAGDTFGRLVDERGGGPPSLPGGERIVGYPSENAAAVDLGDGRHGVIESTQPMALEAPSGRLEPVDLSLTEAHGMFMSMRPVVGVLIPKRSGEGTELPNSGLSLTPVDARGTPVGGAGGVVDGASVFYANTQLDTDTLVKPTTEGFEADTVLRSVKSPMQLYFRVGLPQGANLAQTADGDGPVRVVEGGRTIAVILPPDAIDATGANVPVTMSVTGHLLTLRVSGGAGKYQYPISVDPGVWTTRDKALGPSDCLKSGEAERASSNWCVSPYNSSLFYASFDTQVPELELGARENGGTINAGEYVAVAYHTQGDSRIYKTESTTGGYAKRGVAKFEFVRERSGEVGELEDPVVQLAKNAHWDAPEMTACANPECSYAGGSAGNLFAFKMEATEPISSGTYEFFGWLSYTTVYIAQEQGPEVSVNTTSPTIDEGRTNVLYGSGAWLSPSSGALEMTAHDPGVGVSGMQVEEYPDTYSQSLPVGGCLGVQCPPTSKGVLTYSPGMSDGEHEFEFYAEDNVNLRTEKLPRPEVKVDGTPPHNLEVSGWPGRREISAASHTLTFEATDGENGVPSSGVKSIGVQVDGGPVSIVSGLSCPLGPCTAKGTWTLDAEGLSEGVHSLTVTATDNAGNIAPGKEYTFDVRHGTPVAVGPGSVDPTTGQFKLTAADVSLAGAGSVSRTYESRDLTAGAQGPLGPQWALSVGGAEGLTVLPTGSTVLQSAKGGTATFLRNTKGEFESPLGDGNVKIEAKEKEPGKGITSYVLADSNAGTTTTFTQPNGTEDTPPEFAGQFGNYEGAKVKHPGGVALDASGDVWVTDYENDRVLKFSPVGALLGAYGSDGSGVAQFNGPRDIAINQSTGNLYVTDAGNNRIVELNSKGQVIRLFGWNVNISAKEQFEVCSSFYCKAGTAGSNPGQFNGPKGIAVEPNGNVWVTDTGNDRVEEFTGEGVFLKAFGKEGTGSSGQAQFKEPGTIVAYNGYLDIADAMNDRVQKLTTEGNYVSQLGTTGKAGTGNGEFSEPRGIAVEAKTGNIYVSDTGNNRVQEFTSAGKFITKFGSAGSGNGQFSQPKGMAVGVNSTIYVADWLNNRVQEWTRSSWLPKDTEGPLKSTAAAYAYEPVEEEGKVVVEPTEVLAPAPPGTECGGESGELEIAKLEKGCRALTFKYATSTTATGEIESEWGAYSGHLSQVTFHAWNPVTKTMEEEIVAQYSYDKQGRLRSEWDPRIEKGTDCGGSCSAPETTYGYDAEGHVTALTPPGQESWAFTYGTIAGDANTGRLLKVTRAPASASLWKGSAAKNIALLGVPSLSGSPVVGVRMRVYHGWWSGPPVVYGYQWEDCKSSGGECVPILGANNVNYTPVSGDIGYTLVAEVVATNGDGSGEASTAASAVVAAQPAPYTQTVDSGDNLNAVSCIPSTTDCVLSDSVGKVLYATNVSSSAEATWKTWSGPSGESPSQAIDCPSSSVCLLADGKEAAGGNLYYGMSLGGSFSEAYSSAYGVDAISCVSSSFCVAAQDAKGYFRYSTSPASALWTSEDQGTEAMKGVFCLSSSFCTITDSKGDVYVATSTSQIESSEWKKNKSVDESAALNGIACTSTESCIAVDGAGSVVNLSINSKAAVKATKQDIDGTTSLTAVTCVPSSTCVTVDSAGNVFVSMDSGVTWTMQYSVGTHLTSVSCSSSSLCAAGDTSGKVTIFSPHSVWQEAEAGSPEPGSTIEYHVPVSGSGAPYSLSKEEVEKWGQKDTNETEDNDPVEGMAVFPPDEPQAWPASDYKRAMIDYINSKGLSVNTATPTGGITTTEYNEVNEVVRTLDADNRATAIKEGCESVAKEECKSAEVSEKLDTKTEYNSKNGDIEEVLGPEHKVRLSTGEEVDARAFTDDFYDAEAEGAEEKNKESYNLMTSTTSGALLPYGYRRDVRTKIMSYSGQEDLGWKLRKATSVTTDPDVATDHEGLNLTQTTVYDPTTGNVVETGPSIKPATYSSQFGSGGTGDGQFKHPGDVAVDAKGNLWVLDQGNDRVEEFNEKGEYEQAFGSKGSGDGQLKEPAALAVDSKGNIWVADQGNDRVEEFNEKGEYQKVFGSEGSGAGQFSKYGPEGIAIDPHGDIWVSDTYDGRLEEFNEKGEYMKTVGSEGSGTGQLGEPNDLAIDSEGNVWVADWSNDRVEEFNGKGEYVQEFGSKGLGNGEMEIPYGIAVGSNGDVWVGDTGNQRVQEFNKKGEYLGTFGSDGSGPGQFILSYPIGFAVNSKGDLWVTDPVNNRVEKWTILGDPYTRNSQTIYYSSAANLEYLTCGGRPEWANLPCETKPVAQPEDGLPALPVTTVDSYNIWDEAEVTEEKFGIGSKAVTRTKTETYDPAGRALTSKETASSATDTASPEVTNEYNSNTGDLVSQSTSAGTITSKYNTLDQLTEYKDASGNVAKYAYEEGGDDRLVEVSEGKGEEAASDQTYSYNATNGFMEKLVDSAAGAFTASYDLEGKMVSEVYPNGMCANTTYDSVGDATSLEYIKTRNCSETGASVWFSDSVVPSIHGEALQQISTLSKESYAYDNAGRLIETQETPTGKGCTTRLYGYDEEGGRTSETTREPGGEGKCATEGGTTESHTYDEVNRLTDEGVEYETFGNITKLPANDVDGSKSSHELKSTYYLDNQVATQTQNGETLEYTYDPAGRTLETISEGKTSGKTISHYAGAGNTLTWMSEGGEKWTRNIPGIDGALDAIQISGGTITLQLHDLQGNIVGTAEDNETAAKLLSTYNSTEFGVPQPGTTPPKYAWLGAAGVSAETSLESGISTQDGASYVPQIARDLQTAPIIPAGAFPNGQGTGSENTSEIPGWYVSLSSAESAATLAEFIARQEQERREAEQRAREYQEMREREISNEDAQSPMGEGGPEESICQYAAETGQEVEGCVISEGSFGGSSSGTASASTFWLITKATEVLQAETKKLGNYVVRQVKYQANKLWVEISSTYTLDTAECAQGALAMNNALGSSLEAWPLESSFALLVGCAAETQDGHVSESMGGG
jgi:YD repeat-containing protein